MFILYVLIVITSANYLVGTTLTVSSRKISQRQPSDDVAIGSTEEEQQQHDTMPGIAGVDYPTYATVPLTNFQCSNHPDPGHYADMETACQVFHVCDVDGRHDSFLCPVGTVFSQPYHICDWWFNVDCSRAADYYAENAKRHRPTNNNNHISDNPVDQN